MIGPEIEKLIACLAKLPGLGPRSARRAALKLLKDRATLMVPLRDALTLAEQRVGECPLCFNLDTLSPCAICRDGGRDRSLLCVVEGVADLWAIERSGAYKGLYHVLGGVLSAIDGVTPRDLKLAEMRARLEGIKEVVLGLPATVDGQATAHYLAGEIKPFGIPVTHLAQGVPMGGELTWLDDGTLAAALRARRAL